MKKLNLKLMLALCLCAMLFVLTGCGNTSSQTKLYVGTNAEFAPFEYLEENKVVGFDIDLMQAIAKELNMTMEIKDMNFDGLLPALQAKKVDVVIAGLSKTPEREKAVAFTEPYYTSKQVIVVPKDAELSSFDDLKGKKVGVMLGFTGDAMMTEKEGVEVERFPAAFAGIMALTQGKVDAVVLDSEPAKNYVKNEPTLKIAEVESENEAYVIAVSKDNEALAQKINDALKKLQDNGTIDELLKKYF